MNGFEYNRREQKIRKMKEAREAQARARLERQRAARERKKAKLPKELCVMCEERVASVGKTFCEKCWKGMDGELRRSMKVQWKLRGE